MLFAALVFGTVMAGAADPIEINIGYYETVDGQGRHSTMMDDIIAQFMADNPHITVTTTVAGYSQFYERLPIALATGLGPDVWLSDGVLIDQYSAQGYALDLTDLIEQDMNPDEYFGIEDNRSPDGRIYAFPQGLQSSAFFYNKDMFDHAGLTYPTDRWTWDDVRAAARQLTLDPDGDGTPNQYGVRVINHITEGWFPVIKAFGGGALDASRQNSMFADPNTIAGLQFMADMLLNDGTSPRLGTADRFGWFPKSVVAMQTALYTRVSGSNQSNIDYDVAVLPNGPAGRATPVIVNSWIVNSATSDAKQEAAWEWIKYFSSVKAQTMWSELDEAIPVNRQVAIERFTAPDVSPANLVVFVEGLSNSTPLDPNPVWGDWTGAATRALEEAFRGRSSVTEAALEADHRVQVILDDFYKNQ